MTDICLVTYCLPDEFVGTAPERRSVPSSILNQPPLGVLALAAAVRRSGKKVAVLNTNELYFDFVRNTPGLAFHEFMAGKIAAIEASAYGFSTVCSSFPLTLRIAATVKRLRPEIPVILGGPQATAVAEEVLRTYPEIDFVLRGEADLTLPLLLGAIQGKDTRKFAFIPGLVYRSPAGVLRSAPPPAPVEDLDDLPIPAYDLWSPAETLVLAIEVGRGCPFHCTFCSTSGFFGRKNRLKSPARLMQEIVLLTKMYETRKISFVHDMITVDRRWLLEVTDRLRNAEEGPYEWSCASRSDCVDEALLTEMSRAGCRGIFFGIESGSPRLQECMRKRLNVDEVPRLAETCQELHVGGTFAFITGFPEERESDLRATADLMMELSRYPCHEVQLGTLSPLSGSELYRNHRDSLFFDYAVSTISFQGSALDDDIVSTIRAHPALFPDFYGIPMPNMDRSITHEFQHFCNYLFNFFRWPCVALHQLGIPLYDVFRKWLERRGALDIRADRLGFTYCRMETHRKFRDFLVSLAAKHLPEALDAMETLLAARIYDEQQLEQLSQSARFDGITHVGQVAALAPNVMYRDCPCDYPSIIRSLQAKKGLSQLMRQPCGILLSFRDDTITKEIVSPLTRALIQECNGCSGQHFVADISERVAGRFPSVPTAGHVLFALDRLGKGGVLVFGEPAVFHLSNAHQSASAVQQYGIPVADGAPALPLHTPA